MIDQLYCKLLESESAKKDRMNTKGGVIKHKDLLHRKFMQYHNAYEGLRTRI